MKLQYNKVEAGERIRSKRQLLNMSQEDASAKISISSKYFADIERGSCGMSVETMISIAALLDMSLDYIIYGTLHTDEEGTKHSDEYAAILSLLDNVSENKRKYALRMLQLQVESWDLEADVSSEQA